MADIVAYIENNPEQALQEVKYYYSKHKDFPNWVEEYYTIKCKELITEPPIDAETIKEILVNDMIELGIDYEIRKGLIDDEVDFRVHDIGIDDAIYDLKLSWNDYFSRNLRKLDKNLFDSMIYEILELRMEELFSEVVDELGIKYTIRSNAIHVHIDIETAKEWLGIKDDEWEDDDL